MRENPELTKSKEGQQYTTPIYTEGCRAGHCARTMTLTKDILDKLRRKGKG